MKLKIKGARAVYPPEVCAASRCTSEPAIYVEERGARIPLCDRHWTIRCESWELPVATSGAGDV